MFHDVRRLRLLGVALVLAAALAAALLGSGGGSGGAAAGGGAAGGAASGGSGARAAAGGGAGRLGSGAGGSGRLGAAPARVRHATGARPNIVFVLTDDLSLDLLPYMPHVRALAQRGMTFRNYFVSDSLCCPSRSSIFTGDFPHNTGVLNNVGRNGGFGAFMIHGDELHTFATALHRAGYATAMMGKYLNGYLQQRGGAPVPDSYIPPGWSEWDVAGWGYPEFDYTMNVDGAVNVYGDQPSDYLTDVIAARGVDFIDRSAAADQPFMLELSTFSPHSPYVPAPQDVGSFPELTAPRPPNFNVLPTHPPRWLAVHAPLDSSQLAEIDRVFRLRVESVQSIDRMIARVEDRLVADGVANDTYFVFSSDNGLHTGEYRLTPGKMTAYDTDIHVPLVVAGPGIRPGSTTPRMAENTDLAKTFAAIGGTGLPGDGHSLLSLLHGAGGRGWRDAALIEHRGTDKRGLDPDFQQTSGGSPRTYEAMRTRDFLYVEYDDGEREFYDLRTDPYELHNLARRLTPAQRTLLHLSIRAIVRCHGGTECWRAMHVEGDLTGSSPAAPLP